MSSAELLSRLSIEEDRKGAQTEIGISSHYLNFMAVFVNSTDHDRVKTLESQCFVHPFVPTGTAITTENQRIFSGEFFRGAFPSFATKIEHRLMTGEFDDQIAREPKKKRPHAESSFASATIVLEKSFMNFSFGDATVIVLAMDNQENFHVYCPASQSMRIKDQDLNYSLVEMAPDIISCTLIALNPTLSRIISLKTILAVATY